MNTHSKPEEIVLAYIKNLDNQNYREAGKYLYEKIKIRGPAGEAFTNPNDFLTMLQKYKGKYDIKKVFVDGNDVCLLYDLVTPAVTVFMASWYQVENDKIVSVKTIFDSKLFSIQK